MPLPGNKPTGQPVRRKNKPTHEWTEVADVSFAGGPPLPKTQPGQPTWPTATRGWWKVLIRMPHCILWSQSDWVFALDTAVVHAAFHQGDVKAATELRQREKVMGTTLDSRRDLRIRYVREAPEEERAGVTAIADYKKRLETT